jgi:hypothetical protein
MSARLPAVLLLAAGLLSVPRSASAKDLRSRFALGANAHLGSVPALSARYGLPTGNPAMNVQLEALVGFAAVSGTNSDAIAGGRLLYGVVAEDNMNLFLGAGAGVNVVGGTAALRVQPIMGADFFLFGLENLGFTAEWGVNIDLGDPSAVATSGALGGGVHYWF